MDKSKKLKFMRTGGSLSWSERESMIKEYLTGNYTKVELWQKYTGQSEEHGQLIRWMRTLGHISEVNPIKRRNSVTSHQIPDESEMNNTDKDSAELQRRISELEKQLEVAQMKAEGYDLMIELAEKGLKIPIRKKFDTK